MTTEYTYLLFSPFVFLFVCLLFFICYYLYIYIFFPGKKYALFTKRYKHFQITGQLWR